MRAPAACLLALLMFAAPAQADIVEYLHTDLLGSVVAVSDASGAVIERREYEPFGLPRTPASDGPGYTGHDHDPESGLVYAQQRYYDPEVGRFLSIDPVGVSPAGGNFNRYWYANNNPYTLVDPDGRQADCVDKGCQLEASASLQAQKGLKEEKPLQRESMQQRANEIANEVTERGGFSGKGEADWLYQINSDPNLSVSIPAETLSVEITGPWADDSEGGRRAPGRVAGDDYEVHGQVIVRHRLDGSFGIFDQPYDFEMHLDVSPAGLRRNVLTAAGRPPSGWPNTPFWIRYSGNANVK